MVGASKELGIDPDWGGDLRRDLAGLGLLRVVRGYGPGQWVETDWEGVQSITRWLAELVEHADDAPNPVRRTLGLRWLIAGIDEDEAQRFRKRLRSLGLLLPHTEATRSTVYRFDRDSARRLVIELGELKDGQPEDE